MALALAEAGADVATVDVLDQSEVKAEIARRGRRCVTIEANLGGTADIPRIVQSTLDGLGRIDILVNNAGIIRRAP